MSSRDQDLYDRLAKEPDKPPQSWKPRVGDQIAGVVVKYTEGQTAKYGKKPICVIEADNGEPWSVWLLHQVLLGEFQEQRPKPGERIGIRRLEDHENGYKRYILIVDREDHTDSMSILEKDEYSKAGDVPDEDIDRVKRGRSEAEAMGASHPGGSDFSEFSNEALAEKDDLPF